MTTKGAIIAEKQAHETLLKYVVWLELHTDVSHPTLASAKAASMEAINRLQTEVIDAVPDNADSALNVLYEVLRVRPDENMRTVYETAKTLTQAIRNDDE